MSHDHELAFPDFKAATSFCRWMGCGVVTPKSVGAGFVWHSEVHPLDESQKSKYEAYIGVDSVWRDEESGLTWMDSSVFESLYCPAGFGRVELGLPFAGFSDWRWPTLTELKTLRSSSQDKNGLWRIPALEGKIGSVVRSATKGSHWTVRTDWDFKRDCACEDDDRDSKIVWGSKGQYAGLEEGSSRSTGGDYALLVRGTDSSQRPAWLQAQVQWSETHRVDDFPVTEQTVRMLSELRVRRNNFPPHLDRLAGLRSLYAYDTITLDPGVYSLAALELLSWEAPWHGPEASPPGRLSSAIGDLKHLRTLSVSGRIGVVPDSICDLENLEELDLRCDVHALPAALGRLLRLRKLRIRSKHLSSLPPSIEHLSALTELAVHSEGIQRLPDELSRLRSLVSLDLTDCSLQQLPGQLKELVQLEQLNLSFNPIAALPPDLSALSNLKWLNLCGAPIVEVPPSVREMTSLQSLILSGTQIAEIPEWLWEMKSLRHLTLAKTWKLPRLAKRDHPTIKVDYYMAALDQPWGRQWLQKMGKPD